MAFCFGPRQRPYAPSPLIPNIWVPRSAFLPCSILGALTCFIIPTCIVWSPEVVSLRMARNGVSCPAGFFLPVRVLSRLFRRLFLEYLVKAFDAGKVEFFSSLESLRDRSSFLDYLAPIREAEWVVYAKRPFAGPEQVLDYVGRCTHRVAISNSRLLDITASKVTFRYYGFLGNRYREQKLAHCRNLLSMPTPEPPALAAAKDYRERYKELTGSSLWQCPVCRQGRMLVTQTLPRSPPRQVSIKDTS